MLWIWNKQINMKKTFFKKRIFIIAIVQLLFNQTETKAQTFQWVKTLPGNYFDAPASMVHDSTGNLYISAFYSSSSLDVDPGVGVVNFSHVGGNDAFFGKYDINGNYIWAHSIGGLYDDICRSIKLDKQGNIYISGVFGDNSSLSSTIDFDFGSGTANLTSGAWGDIFIAKYDNIGNYLWAKKIGGTSSEDCWNMEIDSSGNIFVAGVFQNTVDFNPGLGVSNLTSTATGSNKNAFFAKYDSNGNYIWAKALTGSGNTITQSLTIDLYGNIYIAGSYGNATIDFNPGSGVANLTSSVGGNLDIFMAKYDNNGNYVWAKSIGGSGQEQGVLLLDKFGNLYLNGSFNNTIDIDPNVGVDSLYIQPNSSASFIAKFDTSGNYHWAKFINGVHSPSMRIDAFGYLYMRGDYLGTIDADPGYGIANFNTTSSGSLIITKFDSLGNYIYGFKIPGSGGAFNIDDSSNIIVSSAFFSGDFDPGPGVVNLTSAGQNDIFIAKYSQGFCSTVVLCVTSESDFNCVNTVGSANALLSSGGLPLTYLWDTNPVTNVNSINVSSPGLYTVIANDVNGCALSRSTLINGPDTLSEFDLKANLIASPFRPTLPTTVWLDGYNDGCTAISGSLKLVLDASLIFQSAVPAPSQVSGDTLIWNFNNITYDSLHITPQINVTTNLSANIGDTIVLRTFITPSIGDAAPTNNNNLYLFPVVNSYDPNIKQVYPKGLGAQGQIMNNQTMTYSIQFQNTGTAKAINIFILDTLSSNLNVNSLRIIGSSHTLQSYVLSGNVIEFMFNNIQLPDSLANEAQSHGYLLYEIDQNSNLVNGTQIKNIANIYFDNNPAVATNAVINTIDMLETGTEIIAKERLINLYPNPMSNNLIVEFKETFNGIVFIQDIQGRIINSQDLQQTNKVLFSTENLESGIYFVKTIDKDKKTTIYKIVKISLW